MFYNVTWYLIHICILNRSLSFTYIMACLILQKMWQSIPEWKYFRSLALCSYDFNITWNTWSVFLCFLDHRHAYSWDFLLFHIRSSSLVRVCTSLRIIKTFLKWVLYGSRHVKFLGMQSWFAVTLCDWKCTFNTRALFWCQTFAKKIIIIIQPFKPY